MATERILKTSAFGYVHLWKLARPTRLFIHAHAFEFDDPTANRPKPHIYHIIITVLNSIRLTLHVFKNMLVRAQKARVLRVVHNIRMPPNTWDREARSHCLTTLKRILIGKHARVSQHPKRCCGGVVHRLSASRFDERSERSRGC